MSPGATADDEDSAILEGDAPHGVADMEPIVEEDATDGESKRIPPCGGAAVLGNGAPESPTGGL